MTFTFVGHRCMLLSYAQSQTVTSIVFVVRLNNKRTLS